jgi:hypothetical protein
LVATSLGGVLAQRQVRSLCPSCRKQEGKKWRAVGCADCEGTGYKGTVAVFEFLPITDEVRRLIAEKAPLSQIEEAAKKAGFQPMAIHAKTKLERGETDEREIDSTFRRPLADEKPAKTKAFIVPEVEAVAVEAKATKKRSSVEDKEAEEFAEKVRKERDEMNAFFSKQSYEIGDGFGNAA